MAHSLSTGRVLGLMILIALGRFSSAQILTAGVPSGFRNGQLMDDGQHGSYSSLPHTYSSVFVLFIALTVRGGPRFGVGRSRPAMKEFCEVFRG
jgi:hypothetical protein